MTKLHTALIGIAIVAAVLAISAGMGWLHAHPCVRYEPGTCGGVMLCTMFNVHNTCTAWVYQAPYPCEVCAERK